PNQLPPRTTAPGSALAGIPPVSPVPPKQLTSPPGMAAEIVQSVQVTFSPVVSVQSATHSAAFPTMSNTPQLDLHPVREPVATGLPAAETSQSVSPLSVPGSGVPAAARCHSSLVISRLPASAQAWLAWNHVVHVVGRTPGIEAAYSPA